MLRLLGIAGLPILVSAGLALGTGSRFLQLLTLIVTLMMATLFWSLHRSLPSRKGVLTLKGLRERVEVHQDDRGIPHIHAQNLHDLYMAQGYITAGDRLFAMDYLRRTASGQLAEILGPDLLPLDRYFRTLGLHRAAKASLACYSPATQEYLKAYADGVNARIKAGCLPPEFGLLQYSPAPWRPADSLLVGKYLSFLMSGGATSKLMRLRLVQALGAQTAAELLEHPPDRATLNALEEMTSLEEMPLPDLDHLLEIASRSLSSYIGSNGWVVAGSKSDSGAPLLCCDLQCPTQVPSFWYQSHLIVSSAPSVDVSGVAFAGAPGIVSGQNRNMAWSITHLQAEVQDIYIEPLHQTPSQAPVHIQEEIRVRGASRPVIHDVFVKAHRPLLVRGKRAALSLHWALLKPCAEWEAFLQINQASSWSSCKESLRSFDGTTMGFLYAGRDGTIAWRIVGSLPKRTDVDTQLPIVIDGDTAKQVSYVPFDELPEILNPSEGFIAACTSIERTMRLEERLSGAVEMSLPKMLHIQADCTNLQVRHLLQVLLHSVQEGLRQGIHPENLNEIEKTALLILSEWEGEEAAEKPAPALWHQWYLFLLEAIFRPHMGLKLFDQFLGCLPVDTIADRLIHQVACGQESVWISCEGDMSLGRIALRSFRRAVALLSARQGHRPERWRWDREHQLRFEHPLTARLKFLKPLLNVGPYPTGGSMKTLFSQGYHLLRPFEVVATCSWRQIADTVAPERSLDILIPGQSGHFLSHHFSDQIGFGLKGTLLPRRPQGQPRSQSQRLVLLPVSQTRQD